MFDQDYLCFYSLVTANVGALSLASVRNSSSEVTALPRVSYS